MDYNVTRMLTLAEAADKCGVTSNALWQAARLGKLKAVKRGNVWFVKPADLETYRASRWRRNKK